MGHNTAEEFSARVDEFLDMSFSRNL